MHQSTLILSVLQKEHPQIHKQIVDRLEGLGVNKHPITAQNLLKVLTIYNTYHKIDNPVWFKETDLRRKLVAVMLIIFCPEKVHGLVEESTRNRFTKELSVITGCVHQIISRDISLVLTWYKTYSDFRVSIDSIVAYINKS